MQEPDNILTFHSRAVTVAQRVIDGIRPDQLTAPTPCPEWDVRALLNHLIGLHRMFVASAAGDPLPDWETDFVGDDASSAFAASARDADAALRAPGALDRTFRVPWGEISGKMLAWVLFVDLVVHSWDLAKATDQPTSLDPELCATALPMVRAQMEQMAAPRRGDWIGPEVSVPVDAPICDRFAGFMGRQP